MQKRNLLYLIKSQTSNLYRISDELPTTLSCELYNKLTGEGQWTWHVSSDNDCQQDNFKIGGILLTLDNSKSSRNRKYDVATKTERYSSTSCVLFINRRATGAKQSSKYLPDPPGNYNTFAYKYNRNSIMLEAEPSSDAYTSSETYTASPLVASKQLAVTSKTQGVYYSTATSNRQTDNSSNPSSSFGTSTRETSRETTRQSPSESSLHDLDIEDDVLDRNV